MRSRRMVLAVAMLIVPAFAHAALFDFETAPIHTSLPLDLTAGGMTAHFSATGQGYSIQPADAMGFTPAGFSGLCIYPNSVFAADLLIGFSATLSSVSILFAPQELGCDDSALLRLTAYQNDVLVGTSTKRASPPGTWPTGTLAFSSAAGFNRVVIHYDARPPTCQDWGPIFMVDNLDATRSVVDVGSGETEPVPFTALAAPNPFDLETSILLDIVKRTSVTVTIHDVQGRLVRRLFSSAAIVEPGRRSLPWDGCNETGNQVASGVYLCRVIGDARTATTRLVVLRGGHR